MERKREAKEKMDYVENDMKEKGVSGSMTVDRSMEEENVLRRPQVRWDKGR